MQIFHFIVTVVFVLAVDAFALWRVLRWPWVRAMGVSVLINVASLIGAALAYDVVAARVPLAWSQLHVWVKYHLALKGLFFIVAYGATVAIEFFIVRIWEGQSNPWRILLLVASINAVTLAPGAVESVVAGWPRVPKTFTLLPDAPWLEGDGTKLYFFDIAGRVLKVRELGTNGAVVVSQAVPVYGYRVGADGRMCVIGLTNIVSLSWLSVTGRHEVTVPLLLTNVWHVDCAPDGSWYAVASGGHVRMYTLPGQVVTAQVSVGNVEYITAAGPLPSVAWVGTHEKGVLAAGGATNVSATLQPFWAWSPYERSLETGVFSREGVTVTIRDGCGIEIVTPAYTDTFTTVRGARYRGLDFTRDGRSFVFSMGTEVLALEIPTRRVGHVCLGAGVLMTSERERRP
ncbi:MAG: hypothetical protein N2595_06760 [bacterium]|nr:hypothetical protein [bacterium]